MTALIIILSILLLLFAFSMCRLKIIAEYRDKPVITFKLLCFKYVIKQKDKNKGKKKSAEKSSKKAKKKKKSKTKDNKKSSPKESKGKKKNPLNSLIKKNGVAGLIDILKELISLATGVFKGFFKRFIIRNIRVNIVVGGDDAADTAVQYGSVCAVVYPIMGQIYSRLNVLDYSADINCDFSENSKTKAEAHLFGTIRVIFIFSLVIKALFRALKTYIKMRFR